MPFELKSLSKGLDVLLAFGLERPLLSVDELAKDTGIPKSSLYKFLENLGRKGFVRYDPLTRKYGPGVALFRLGRVSAESINLVGAASPVMRRLVDETGESAYLSVRVETERVCIDFIESPQGHIKYAIKPGATSPLHAGASGKVLLAFLPEAEQHDLVKTLRLTRVAPATITRRGELGRRLVEIRKRGWDLSEEELAVGTWGLAVPILDPDRRAIASLTLAGALVRRDERRRRLLVPRLRAAAEEIEKVLWEGRMP
jgi:DNA-binding IclR family transcriptional regulator